MTKLLAKILNLSLAILLAAAVPAAAAGRSTLAAEDAETKPLPYGVLPCDVFNEKSSKYYNKNFALFDNLLQLLGWSEVHQTTWCGSGGGSQYTILAPVNAAVASGLSHLHSAYGTQQDASKFKSVGYPLVYNINPVQIAFDAIVENSFIPFPIDFYTNGTVLKATKAHPLKLPTYSAFAYSYIEVYTENGIVHGTVPGKTSLVPGRFTIPNAKTYIGPFRKGDDTKIFVYGINKLLVPELLRVPLTTGPERSMASYLKDHVGKCSTAYDPSTPAKDRAPGCKTA